MKLFCFLGFLEFFLLRRFVSERVLLGSRFPKFRMGPGSHRSSLQHPFSRQTGPGLRSRKGEVFSRGTRPSMASLCLSRELGQKQTKKSKEEKDNYRNLQRISLRVLLFKCQGCTHEGASFASCRVSDRTVGSLCYDLADRMTCKLSWFETLSSRCVKQPVNGPGVVNRLSRAFEKERFRVVRRRPLPLPQVVPRSQQWQILPMTVAVFCNRSTSSKC